MVPFVSSTSSGAYSLLRGVECRVPLADVKLTGHHYKCMSESLPNMGVVRGVGVSKCVGVVCGDALISTVTLPR